MKKVLVHGVMLMGVAGFLTVACTNTPSESSSSSSGGGGGGSSSGGQASSGGASGNAGSSGMASGGGSSRPNSSSRRASSQGNTSGFMLPDGGFGDFDASVTLTPYMGEQEPGIKCGANICDHERQDLCCLGFGGEPACENQMCGGFGLSFACDGPEDCRSGDVCCANTLAVACTPQQDCVGMGGILDPAVVCTRDAECPSGTACCSAGGLIAGLLMGVDFGTCQAGCPGSAGTSSSSGGGTSSSVGATSQPDSSGTGSSAGGSSTSVDSSSAPASSGTSTVDSSSAAGSSAAPASSDVGTSSSSSGGSSAS